MIRFTNKKRTSIEYYNKNQELVTENFGQMILRSLQKAYMACNYHLTKTQPEKIAEIDAYDLEHNLKLSIHSYQKQIMKYIGIQQKKKT